jgi:hypothetical protein
MRHEHDITSILNFDSSENRNLNSHTYLICTQYFCIIGKNKSNEYKIHSIHFKVQVTVCTTSSGSFQTTCHTEKDLQASFRFRSFTPYTHPTNTDNDLPVTQFASQMAPCSPYSALRFNRAYEPWGRVVHYKENTVPFGMQP